MKSIAVLVFVSIIITSCGNQRNKTTTLPTNTIIDSAQIRENNSIIELIEETRAPEILRDTYTLSQYDINETALENFNTCNDISIIRREKLGSGTNLYWETIDRNDKNKIKLFGLVGSDFDKNTKAFVFDYSNYLDTFCKNGNEQVKMRLIAGVRIIYTVKDWKLNTTIDALEKIAASKELNISQSSLIVKTIGWGQESSAVDSLKSTIQNINVKNYAASCHSLLGLMSAFAATESVRPEKIPIN